MDIYTKSGQHVVFAHPDSGYDQKKAAGHLEVGKTYTVDHTTVHDWNTDAFLQEVPGVPFNSTMFNDVVINVVVGDRKEEEEDHAEQP